ncbi:MAG: DEAD/DEAH box helicase [Phycisphaeraceae bacterium]|nr:DEAD/DEAH box helicase [Phycisphaeraceae bacterium]
MTTPFTHEPPEGSGSNHSHPSADSAPDHSRSDGQGGQEGDQPRKRRRRRRRGGGGGEGGEGGGGQGGSAQGQGSGQQHGGGQALPAQRRLRAKDAAPLSDEAKRDIFDTTITFADLGLSKELLDMIGEVNFVHPTQIQAQIIPLIIQGKDVLGQARTGTGKTAAFGLPMLEIVKSGTEFQGLVLVPTRELAIQVAADLAELGLKRGLTVLPVYGGQNIRTQADKLAKGPEIIVATPGRVMDMQQRGYLHYRNVRIAVLDEVDRMLDIGFRDDIRKILSACPTERQTVFVSATISSEIESLARKYARNAEKIVASSGSLTAAMVKQFYLTVQPWDKRSLLLHLLTHEEPALTVIFCRMKRTVDEVTAYLMKKGIDAHAMHGDMYQTKRNQVIAKLRTGSLGVLVASDLASRGLDVEGISHVINYDLPEDPDLYVHRIGRTARAGRDGVAWSLVTPEQGGLLTQIELLINAEIPKLDYPDFKPGPVPKGVIESQELDAKRAELAKTFNRYAATPATTIGHVSSELADPNRFPGGIVPSKLPDRRLGGRIRTARSMKAAISQTFMTPPPGATPGETGPASSAEPGSRP